MKGIALIMALSGFVFAGAQVNPKLEPAQAVDIRTQSVQWHPHGTSLLYSREEDKGVGIGMYRMGDSEGKVLLHLNKDDVWNAEWFEGADSVLITVRHKASGSAAGDKEVDLYVLDAKARESREVYSKISPDRVEIDSELSPYFVHAIFTMTEGKKSFHMVLPTNGAHLVPSTDIDTAVVQGLNGPAWSVDGTGLYGKGFPMRFNISFNLGSGSSGDGNGFQLVLGGNDDGSGNGSQTFAVAALLNLSGGQPPEVGADVFEVVPTNGVLRQVRYRGPWADQAENPTTLEPKGAQVYLQFGNSQGTSKSLWLFPKPDSTATLVAAHAESGQLSPGGKAISYIVDGALFVRKIAPGF